MESHDPRPESTIMAGWGAGLTNTGASIADVEQPPRKALPLKVQGRITDEGEKADSTLPFIRNVNQAPEFNVPKEISQHGKTTKRFSRN